jgi:predicted transcriptional regulator of viral defense system
MVSFSRNREEGSHLQATPQRAGRLSRLIEELQAKGICTVTKQQATEHLGISGKRLDEAARRLRSKGGLITPRRGFYVIVPPEYRTAGAPPPSWFIDALMAFHGQPYYVGLLSAAELHGAAHHRPQEFQVITNAPLRPIVVGRGRLRFFVKRRIGETPTAPVKTHTGYMQVSTPEATAFDLVRYVEATGHLDNVATVLAELVEKIESRRLVAAAKSGVELSVVQRTGYLLDLVGAARVTDRLAAWLVEQAPLPTPLRPDRPSDDATADDRWQLLVNEKVEPDV